jgi:hypothetical protein
MADSQFLSAQQAAMLHDSWPMPLSVGPGLAEYVMQEHTYLTSDRCMIRYQVRFSQIALKYA